MAISWSLTIEGEPTEDDLGHIAELVQQGYTSGELVDNYDEEEELSEEYLSMLDYTHN